MKRVIMNKVGSQKKLAIIIINYKTPDLVIQCLQSLSGQMRKEYFVVIVDNDSSDDSPEKIKNAIYDNNWTRWTKVICLKENIGFAGGNNVGIKSIIADYYLLLNSDTIAKPKLLTDLISAAEKNEDAGIISPRIELEDGDLETNARKFLNPISEFISSASTGIITKSLNRFYPFSMNQKITLRCDWICFACALVKRQVIDDIGLLDDGYFMYYDDVDYCRRAKQAGWSILYWPKSTVIHLKGKSGPVESQTKHLKRRPRYYYAARSRYFAKFYGTAGFWFVNVLWGAGRAISGFREILGNKDPHACKNEFLDNWTNWTNPLKMPLLGNRKK